MENSLRYQVRSREIIDLVGAMRTGRLTISPYFQRNLVWRDTHKHDFIDTILLGYPFPQIFLARGPINIETMEASTCVVDGQQRLNAIREFVSDKFPVNGRKFSELKKEEKEAFLKYEVPVIDFDLDADDKKLKEVFKRLNRTFYSLSAIEQIATEFSASQFLLVARILSGDITQNVSPIEEEIFEDSPTLDTATNNPFIRDPAIEKDVWEWLIERADGSYCSLIASDKIFSNYEAQRKVPLMFVLNVMSSIISGYYNRNAKVKEYLERFNDSFEEADSMIGRLNETSIYISKLNLDDSSIWWNKANFFTLSVEAYQSLENLPEPDVARENLLSLEQNLPESYSFAAREAVNNKTQRETRAEFVRQALGLTTDE